MENQTSPQRLASTAAYVAALLFFFLIIMFATVHNGMIIGIVAVTFHVLLFPVVANLPSTEWARACGYGWIMLDIASNMMQINGVDEHLCSALRYGAHIPAVIWIITSSMHCNRQMLSVGLVQGVIMAGYSFIAPWAPAWVLYPAMILLIVWLFLAGRFLATQS
jgi:hypothetical protein